MIFFLRTEPLPLAPKLIQQKKSHAILLPMKRLILACTFPFLLQAQMADTAFTKKNPGFAPAFFTAGYRLPLANHSVINSGHGIYTEAGFNPGAFLSGKTILGLFAGWGWQDKLWATAFDGNFVHDYKQAIDHDLVSSALDSAIIATSAKLFESKKGSSPTMPGCEMRSFHNYTLYYGLIIKLPQPYAPALKLYRGSTRSHYHGPSGLVSAGTDYNSFQLRRAMYGCELMLLNLPGFIQKNKETPKALQRLGLSLYYEYCDFSTSALHFNDGDTQRLIPLKQFMPRSFFDSYRNEHQFGCKFSYTFI